MQHENDEIDGNDVFDVPSFCKAHKVSRALFYQLLRDGRGPRTYTIGRRRYITREAAATWRTEMEMQGAA